MPLIVSIRQPAFAGKIGIAGRDVTPPVGIYARQWGAAVHDVAEGVHRPLVLTALSMEADGGEPLVLIALDGFMFRSNEDEYRVRGAVLQALRIPPSRLMLNVSHTHASCSLSMVDADKPGGTLIGPYLEQVRDAAVGAALEARTTAEPAVLAWDQGRCGLARNRDFRDPHADRYVCGYNPAGPEDDTVLVGRVTREADGNVMGVIVNYACHPTTLAWDNRLISPDFVGAMREVVEREIGGAPVMFLQGASGELAPRRQYTGDVQVADANGRELGHAAASVLAAMLPDRTRLDFLGVRESGAALAEWELRAADVGCTLSVDHGQVELPLKPQPTEAEIVRKLESCTNRTQQERLHRKRWHVRHLGSSRACLMPYWTWRLGDAVIVSHPNEAYSQMQVELRRRFPSVPVIVMNLTNGTTLSYLYPAEKAGQELYQVSVSPFQPEALSRLIDACTQSIERCGFKPVAP
jgi:hypothetical protein